MIKQFQLQERDIIAHKIMIGCYKEYLDQFSQCYTPLKEDFCLFSPSLLALLIHEFIDGEIPRKAIVPLLTDITHHDDYLICSDMTYIRNHVHTVLEHEHILSQKYINCSTEKEKSNIKNIFVGKIRKSSQKQLNMNIVSQEISLFFNEPVVKNNDEKTLTKLPITTIASIFIEDIRPIFDEIPEYSNKYALAEYELYDEMYSSLAYHIIELDSLLKESNFDEFIKVFEIFYNELVVYKTITHTYKRG